MSLGGIKTNIGGRITDSVVVAISMFLMFLLTPIDYSLTPLYLILVFVIVAFPYFKSINRITKASIIIIVYFLIALTLNIKIYLTEEKYFIHCTEYGILGSCNSTRKITIAGKEYYVIPLNGIMQSVKSYIYKSFVGTENYNSLLIKESEHAGNDFLTPPSEKLFVEMRKSEGLSSNLHASLFLTQTQHRPSPVVSIDVPINVLYHTPDNIAYATPKNRTGENGEWVPISLQLGNYALTKSKINIRYPLSTHQSSGYIFTIKGDINTPTTWAQLIEADILFKAILGNKINAVHKTLLKRSEISRSENLDLFYDTLELAIVCSKNNGFGFDVSCLEQSRTLLTQYNEKIKYSSHFPSLARAVTIDLLEQVVNASGLRSISKEDIENMQKDDFFQRVDFLGYKANYFSLRLKEYGTLLNLLPKESAMFKYPSPELLKKMKSKDSKNFIFGMNPVEAYGVLEKFIDTGKAAYQESEESLIERISSLPYKKFVDIVDQHTDNCGRECASSFFDLYKSIPKPLGSLNQEKMFSIFMPALLKYSETYKTGTIRKRNGKEIFDAIKYLGEQAKLQNLLTLKQKYILKKIPLKYQPLFNEIYSAEGGYLSLYNKEIEILGGVLLQLAEKSEFEVDEVNDEIVKIFRNADIFSIFGSCKSILTQDLLDVVGSINLKKSINVKFATPENTECLRLLLGLNPTYTSPEANLLLESFFELLDVVFDSFNNIGPSDDEKVFSEKTYQLILASTESETKRFIAALFSEPFEAAASDMRSYRILVYNLVYNLIVLEEKYAVGKIHGSVRLKSLICRNLENALWWEAKGLEGSELWKDVPLLMNIIPIVKFCDKSTQTLELAVKSTVPSNLIDLYLEMQVPWFIIPKKENEIIQLLRRKILENAATDVEIELFIRWKTKNITDNDDWYVLGNVGETSILNFINFIKRSPKAALHALEGGLNEGAIKDELDKDNISTLMLARSIRIIDPIVALNILRKEEASLPELVETCNIYLQLKKLEKSLVCINNIVHRQQILNAESTIGIVDSLYKIGRIGIDKNDIKMIGNASFLLLEISKLLDVQYQYRDKLYRKMLYAFFDYCDMFRINKKTKYHQKCAAHLRNQLSLLSNNFKNSGKYSYFVDLFERQFSRTAK